MTSIADGVRAGMPAGDRGGTGHDVGHALALAALALARRFADGATLWCLAPEWPEHARHVAVEFVHPVVVGKRALPAVSVSPSNPVATLRAAVRAGDVVLVVSRHDEPVTHSVLRRAQAWGASTIWLGVQPLPPAGTYSVSQALLRPVHAHQIRAVVFPVHRTVGANGCGDRPAGWARDALGGDHGLRSRAPRSHRVGRPGQLQILRLGVRHGARSYCHVALPHSRYSPAL